MEQRPAMLTVSVHEYDIRRLVDRVQEAEDLQHGAGLDRSDPRLDAVITRKTITRVGTSMGKTIMGVAAVFLDGFIADDNDDVGPLFDWFGSGDVGGSLPGSDDEARSSRASADFMTSHYANTAANVIGRRLFDLTNGWDGKPAAYEHVFVVTHHPPTDWEHVGTAPFTFADGVEKAIAAAKEFAGDRDVDVAGGQIGSQALQLGLIDQEASTSSRWSSALAGRSSPPARCLSRCGWRTRSRSCKATASPISSTTLAAEARYEPVKD
jgi:dihydrofolate reductase